jgi:hypothetical protein
MGDDAEMAILELVDFNDVINAKAEEHKEKREAKAKAKKENQEKEVAEEANVVEETAAKEVN